MKEDIKSAAIQSLVASRFPEMSQEGIELLHEYFVERKLAKGEILIHQGDIAPSIVLVGKGMLRQYYYKNKKDVTEHFSYEGCVLMCIESMLKQEPSRQVVEALEPSIIYEFSYSELSKLVEISLEINRLYRKVLEYSLITSQIKADSSRFETAKERYSLLMKMHPEIIKRAPLAHIASYLLMTPETLSRVRSGAL